MFKIFGFCSRRYLKNVKNYGSTSAPPPPSATGELDDHIVFGGELQPSVMEGSLGTILFNRMKNENRLSKILQTNMSGSESMTTNEFIKQSVGVAQGLVQRGVKMGDVVFVCGENSLIMNVSLMGVIWHGATAAPISPQTSHDNMKILLKLLKPSFYLCEENNVYVIRRMVKQVLGPLSRDRMVILANKNKESSIISHFNDFIETNDWEKYTPPKIRSAREDLAFIMSAKSDEGSIRGVGLTHRNFAYTLTRYLSFYNPTALADEVLLQVQKTIWMSGINTLLMSCYFGCKMVVVDRFDETAVLDAIQHHKVTFMYIHPAKLWRLLKYPDLKSYDFSSFTDLHIVGSKMSQPIIDHMKNITGIDLKEVYGSTELGGGVTNPTVARKTGSVGKLAPGCYGKVYSSSKKLGLGPNKTGELCFKGPSVMKGYINDEKSTKAKIDKDSFVHTKDVGSYDTDGYFYVIGRLNNLIKIKDQLIAPQEIEEIIKSREDVKDVAVGGMSSSAGKVLVAFVVKRKDTASSQDILSFVKERFDETRRVQAVVFINKIPRYRTSSSINREMLSQVLRKYRYKQQPQQQSETHIS